MKAVLIETIRMLDDCWVHHQDGSYLNVTEDKLFDIIQNGALKNLKQLLKEVIKEEQEGYACSRCGLKTPIGRLCVHCNDTF